jgi:DNA ligase (NAD+)
MVKLTKVLINKLIKDPIAHLKTISEDEIAAIIQQASNCYYNSDKPMFPDNTFDIIKDYLEELNPNHPILKNVGCSVSEEKKVKLPLFMGSLDKIKTDPKLFDKFTNQYGDSYVISDKLDGNSAMIVWKKNTPPIMYSRGDGEYGQDISHLVPFIQGIPSSQDISQDIIIRGEVICSKEDFKKHFATKMANARNMVAGLINSKLPDLEVAKYTQFIAYEIMKPQMKPEDQMKELQKKGFRSVNHKIIDKLDVAVLSDLLVQRRKESPFEIDGIVVMHNAIHNRPKDGNPKYGFAFKSVQTMEKAEVIVTHVEWNMSKDGYLIPVVNFNAVNLAGVMIKRAHGFNGKFIKDNKIGPGAVISIMRSGDVIPNINGVITPTTAQMPDVPYKWSGTGVDIIVEDSNASKDSLQLKNLEYFFNKIDIVGLSTGNVTKIYDAGFKTVGAIFKMTKEDFLKVQSFKEKMAEKLYNALQEKKDKIDCVALMDASNTLGRGIGSKKIALITDAFPAIIYSDYVPSQKELVSLSGIEKKTADAIIENLPKFFKWRKDNGLTCGEAQSQSPKSQIDFKGQIIVFTGVRDKDLEKLIEAGGGKVSTSVSSKTTLVVCKDANESSSKLDKAKDLGVKIMTLSEFKMGVLKI